MPDKRTRKAQVISDESEYYKPLRDKRDIKKITHFKTPKLKNPTVSERARIRTITHIWSYGDRFIKLAHQYYGDGNYWWVIAWYNGVSIEAEIDTGRILYIPTNLEDALNVLGV